MQFVSNISNGISNWVYGNTPDFSAVQDVHVNDEVQSSEHLVLLNHEAAQFAESAHDAVAPSSEITNEDIVSCSKNAHDDLTPPSENIVFNSESLESLLPKIVAPMGPYPSTLELKKRLDTLCGPKGRVEVIKGEDNFYCIQLHLDPRIPVDILINLLNEKFMRAYQNEVEMPENYASVLQLDNLQSIMLIGFADPFYNLLSGREMLRKIHNAQTKNIVNESAVKVLNIVNESAVTVLSENPLESLNPLEFFPLLNFGDDILSYFCTRLSIEDIGKFAQLNKRFAKLTDDKLFWELVAKNLDIEIKLNSEITPKKQFKKSLSVLISPPAKLNLYREYIKIKPYLSQDNAKIVFEKYVPKDHFVIFNCYSPEHRSRIEFLFYQTKEGEVKKLGVNDLDEWDNVQDTMKQFKCIKSKNDWKVEGVW